jgi:hypothetical protein
MRTPQHEENNCGREKGVKMRAPCERVTSEKRKKLECE